MILEWREDADPGESATFYINGRYCGWVQRASGEGCDSSFLPHGWIANWRFADGTWPNPRTEATRRHLWPTKAAAMAAVERELSGDG